MRYQDLLGQLPSRDTQIPLDDEAPPGSSAPEREESEIFVPPELEAIHVPEDYKGPRIVLVCAAAAVGKSSMAKDLARTTKNPYWDLSRFDMGSGFFAGTISGAYGLTKYAEVVTALRDGTACLILDAADEAVVGSTTKSYRIALDNLIQVLGGAGGPLAKVIIFGRHETILETASYLGGSDVECEILEVSYFDREAALDFVRLRAKAITEEPLLPQFDEFVERFNDRVMKSVNVGTWKDISSFLGYAPVLESLAVFYASADNQYRRLSEFFESEEHYIWNLLADMLDEVLKREREKFAKSFGGEDVAKQQFARSAYEPKTQIEMMFKTNIDGFSADPDINDSTDPDWLTDIDEKLREQFRVHPFLKRPSVEHGENTLLGFTSVAFRDYALSRAIGRHESHEVEQLVEYWSSARVVPSIILSRFLFDHSELERIPVEALPILVDSHGAGHRSDGNRQRELWLEWDSDDSDDDTDLIASSRGAQSGEARELRISGVQNYVKLGRNLTNFVAVVPGLSLVLGESSMESTVGTGVKIQCEGFAVRSGELRVLPAAQIDGPSQIEATRLEGVVRSIVGSPESLQMIVPPVPFPWQRFRIEKPKGGTAKPSDLASLGIQVRAFWARFERGAGAYTLANMNTILAKGRVSSTVLDYLQSADLVWRNESSYRMDLRVPSDAVRRVDLENPDLLALLQELSHYRASLVA